METRLHALQTEREREVARVQEAAKTERGEWTEGVLLARAEQLRVVKQVCGGLGEVEAGGCSHDGRRGWTR